MNKLFLYVVAMITLGAVSAHADRSGTNAKNFETRILAYKQSCNQGCMVPFAEFPAGKGLDAKTLKSLQAVAFDQAQIWGDTILEGDYYADGKTRLDAVSSIYENQTLVGYKITYSERAWYTADCEFDYDKPQSLKECKEGRIQESSFVSPDFKTYFRDENDYAEFN